MHPHDKQANKLPEYISNHYKSILLKDEKNSLINIKQDNQKNYDKQNAFDINELKL